MKKQMPYQMLWDDILHRLTQERRSAIEAFAERLEATANVAYNHPFVQRLNDRCF
jgi:hypothetical protein